MLGNDSDPDGDPLSVTSATVDPAKGTVGVNPDGTLNFVPAPNYNGPAVITYTISDGNGGTATCCIKTGMMLGNMYLLRNRSIITKHFITRHWGNLRMAGTIRLKQSIEQLFCQRSFFLYYPFCC